jgi:arabinan endo-1,5-alpha-L-arabinosidase
MESGTWTDLGATGVQSDGSTPYNAIDAAAFLDGSTWRMYFGSWWDGLFTVDLVDPPAQAAEGQTPVNLIIEPVTTAVVVPS